MLAKKILPLDISYTIVRLVYKTNELSEKDIDDLSTTILSSGFEVDTFQYIVPCKTQISVLADQVNSHMDASITGTES